MSNIAEFRGCDNLYIAEVTADTAAAYTAGSPIHLCEIAQVAKTTEQSSETHFYDNKAAITIKAVGADTVQLIVPAMVLAALAKVTGASIDAQTGAYIDRGAKNAQKFYALGYRVKLTDGTYRYVWKQKGTFTSVPDETSQTESNAVNTNNQTIQFGALDTTHEFTNGGSSRTVYCDERDGLADLSVDSWFASVKTPDNLPSAAATVTALTVSKSTMAIDTGDSDTATYTITPSTAAASVVSSNPGVATVSVAGTTITVNGVHAGTSVVSVTAGSKSVSIAVTVSDP